MRFFDTIAFGSQHPLSPTAFIMTETETLKKQEARELGKKGVIPKAMLHAREHRPHPPGPVRFQRVLHLPPPGFGEYLIRLGRVERQRAGRVVQGVELVGSVERGVVDHGGGEATLREEADDEAGAETVAW